MPERFGDFFRRLLAMEGDPRWLVSRDLRDEAVHVVVGSQTPVAARCDLLGQVQPGRGLSGLADQGSFRNTGPDGVAFRRFVCCNPVLWR
jgi:hypothetical protein